MKYKDLQTFKNFLKEKEEMKFVERNFSFFIYKNLIAVDNELVVLDKIKEKIISDNSRFLEYEPLRTEIIKKYCDKDSNGNPIIHGNQPQINPEFIEVLNTEITELNERYKDDIEKMSVADREFMNVLESTVESLSSFQLIKESDIPRNVSISAKDWQIIDSLVKR